MDKNVRKYAHEIQDTVLLAKLSSGDMISQEAVYHRDCYRDLFHRARKEMYVASDDVMEKNQTHGIALAELVNYIEDVHSDSDVLPVFKLSDLMKLYKARVEQLGKSQLEYIHATQLKNRILKNIPDLRAHKQGRDVLLVFSTDIGDALKQASEHDFDGEAIILAKAANIIRRDMLEHKRYTFNGFLDHDCQEESIPRSLQTVIAMILGGTDINSQSANIVETQAQLTIAQLIKFNSTIRRRKYSTGTYNAKDRECPLPMYVGMLVHAATRKRGLVDKLNDIGLSVSYNRVLELSSELGHRVCEMYKQQNIVCPSNLKLGLFTTSAVDNIDHNPSSTTSQGSFHGTGISIFQHPESDNDGNCRAFPDLESCATNTTGYCQLPEVYQFVPPVAVPCKLPNIPSSDDVPTRVACDRIPSAIQSQYMWLEHVRTKLTNKDDPDIYLSWSAYHASLLVETPHVKPAAVSALLPLFEEQAKSLAMIKHSMNIVSKTIDYLNSGQTPVITCDQPLYSLAKQIQWIWPETHGNFVVMFGGLHIEIAALKTIGDWLENSGWTHALDQAKIASSGTAESFLKASHVSKTRHAHQITASALHILMYNAFMTVHDTVDESLFESWRKQRESESPQFLFWSITLRFQLAILIFVKSLREGDFELYKQSLVTLVPWFFALDHSNYARWIPVHIHDMAMLAYRSPDVAEQFNKGNFVVRKTQNLFSGLPIDQAHEQNNKLVKGDGGAVGLTENSQQLLRWMVCGPEIARVVNEFQSSVAGILHVQSKGPDLKHQQIKSTQTTFRQQVLSLVDTIQSMGNPFEEQSEDLLILDTRDIVDDSVVTTVRRIEQAGIEQYNTFVMERIDTQQKPLAEPIKQNKFPLFSRQTTKTVSKQKNEIVSLKQNCSLFAKLYVSCQIREGDLNEFFLHENTNFPPSLSQFGSIRLGTKSDLLRCLEVIAPPIIDQPDVDALIIDGAVLVNMLKPIGCLTFNDYVENVFKPYLERSPRHITRIDVVWDVYVTDSLKGTTRSARGKGVRRRVSSDTRIPGNWHSFLRVDENKTELFKFLADKCTEISIESKLIISTRGADIVSNSNNLPTNNLAPCSHEEADTRVLLHTSDAANHGFRKIMLRTVDTDIIVLAIAAYPQLLLDELWVAFGTGKNLRYFPIHSIVDYLGERKAKALPAFHAFTGCDQTSAFLGKDKKTAWETWHNFNDVTDCFISIYTNPSYETLQNAMSYLERFVVLMYDKTSVSTSVNDTRKMLFTQKGRSIESIPPTRAALWEHCRRVAYQAGFCWGQALVASPELPSPADWGWQRNTDGHWIPYWSALPQASSSCQELLRCNCKPEKGCRGNCKCIKSEMLCTALCLCGGNCDRG